MEINGRRIINPSLYIGHLAVGSTVRVLSDITGSESANLLRAGFDEHAGNGSTILPSIVGTVTRFNSEGRWVVHRDQPKEMRYVGTRVWRWKQWNGDEEERQVDVERLCYPRTLIPPPSIQLTLVTSHGRRLLVSPPVVKADNLGEEIKHVINLLLELFRSCSVTSEQLEDYQPPQTIGVNWKFLPPGEYPWPALRTHIERSLEKASDDTRAIIEDRAETIRAYAPDRIFVGQGGFGDYLAYEFVDKGKVVLEAIRRDNALYVFGNNWEHISQLSKAQVISGNLHEHRIIHSDGWKARLAQVLIG